MLLTIDSKIRFRLTPDLKNNKQFIQAIRQDMLIDNPEYKEAIKYNRYAGNIQEHIALWEYDALTGTLAVPRGYGRKLSALLKSFRVGWEALDERVTLKPVDFGSSIKLRDYQVPAVEAALKATGGVLQAPAGSGKTEMGLEIIARLGQPALWLTHTKDLANQAAQRACAVLGIEWPELGLIGDGTFMIGDRLTIGIIQTMTRIPVEDWVDVGQCFGTVVLDEAHHGAAPTWISVMNQLPARYRFGVTATFERADGLEVITERVIGPTCHTVSRAAVSDRLMVPGLRAIQTGIESEVWQKYEERMATYQEKAAELRLEGKPVPKPPTMPFGAILDELLTNDERNMLIVETLLEECPGHYSLVLSKRVEHCLQLAHLLSKTALDRGIKSRLTSSVIHGKLDKKVREKAIELTRDGKVDVLFAVEIAKEGLDIPRLDRLFIVGGGRNEAETEQKVGRIQRVFVGKSVPMVFDFVDELVPPLRAQHWKRRAVYQRLGMVAGRRRKASSE